jgi:cytochrome P450
VTTSTRRDGAGACPVHAGFDPFSPGWLADPYARLHELPPVFHAPGLDMWVLTRHADLETVFRDPETYSAAIAQDPLFPLTDEARAALGPDFPLPRTMSNADPPDHARIRRVNLRAFSARRTAALEPRVREAAARLVAALPRDEPFDLVAGLTHPLPAFMIFTLIGFPEADTELLTGWCGNRLAFSWGRPTPAEQRDIAVRMRRYWEYCTEFVARRRHDPRDDFTSDLLRVHLAEPDRLSPLEIASVIYGLSFAGHETTTNLTSNAVRTLLAHREQWDALCADPGRIPDAVEEVLRHDSSVIAWRRRTTRPVRVAGCDIPAGARLLLLLAAADRDPARFAEPDRFDIGRTDTGRHLAFGRGAHYCLGAPLARMEARIVLEELTGALPGLRPEPGPAPEFPPNVAFRGPRALWLRAGPRPEEDT